MKILLIVVVVVVAMNLVTFVVYGIDKTKAQQGAWRIPENTLICLAALFGSIGALAGMFMFHHKTRKSKFIIGVPVILVVQVVIVIAVSRLVA